MSLMLVGDKEVRISSSDLSLSRLKTKKQIINSSSSKIILNFLPICLICEECLFAILFKESTCSTFESAAEMLLLWGSQMLIIWFRVKLHEQLPRTYKPLKNRYIKHSSMDFCHIIVSNTIVFAAEFSGVKNKDGVWLLAIMFCLVFTFTADAIFLTCSWVFFTYTEERFGKNPSAVYFMGIQDMKNAINLKDCKACLITRKKIQQQFKNQIFDFESKISFICLFFHLNAMWFRPKFINIDSECIKDVIQL